LHDSQASSHGLTPSFRVPRASSDRPTHHLAGGQTVQPGRLPSLRFSAPTASPRSWQQLRWTGLPHPAACALRFSQPLGALIRLEPAGLVSCRIRSWGCALQSVAPPVQPYAVSGADPLLPLDEPEEPYPPYDPGRRSALRRAGPATTIVGPPKRPYDRQPLGRGSDLPTAGLRAAEATFRPTAFRDAVVSFRPTAIGTPKRPSDRRPSGRRDDLPADDLWATEAAHRPTAFGTP
jgi:hypothetical protein